MAGPIKCWEHFACKEADCPAYRQDSKPCWLESGTCCHGAVQSIFMEKIELCLECEVFKESMDHASVREADSLTSVIYLLETAKKKQQAQFHFLQALVDSIPSPIFYKDKAGRYLGCNKAYQTYVGLTQEELVGKTVHELWPKKLADKYRQMDMDLFAKGGTQLYEAAVRFADGTMHDVVFNKAIFNDNEGSLGGLVGVILDITERKAAEEALVFRNVLLTTQQEASIDGILVVDENARILSFNRRLVDILSIPARLLETKDDEPILKYLTSQVVDPEKFLEKVRYLYEHPHETSRDELVLRNGRTLDRYSAPLLGEDGRYYGRFWSLRDITEQRRAEEAKSRLEAQLHHSRMMDSFMIQLGHDMKTPLTPLLILLPLIKKQVVGGELERMVDICCKNIEQIRDLTAKSLQLVSLSMVTTGELESINLASAVECLCDDSSELLAEKNISCEIAIYPSIVVRAVSSQLNVLFMNLISNAARYSPENGVIRIAAELEEDDVLVSLHDDGIGVDSTHLERIFDEFYKVDESRHDTSSPGLGLSICKKIISNHKGRIWAESPGTGQGTTILFSLPRTTI